MSISMGPSSRTTSDQKGEKPDTFRMHFKHSSISLVATLDMRAKAEGISTHVPLPGNFHRQCDLLAYTL